MLKITEKGGVRKKLSKIQSDDGLRLLEAMEMKIKLRVNILLIILFNRPKDFWTF